MDEWGSSARNLFCRFADLGNEASVEDFFVTRLIADLGYEDSQIAPQRTLDSLAVGQGRRSPPYKPDFALLIRGTPRCIIEAKGVDEDLDDWIGQCSGYCLALNRKYGQENPVRYFLLSNGRKTILYQWDRDEPLLELDFADFTLGNPKYAHLKSIVGAGNITTSVPTPMAIEPVNFRFARPSTARARQLFVNCHNLIRRSEGYGPGPAFMAFVKLMFVKLWTDKNIRDGEATRHLFEGDPDMVMLPKSAVTFSEEWIRQREAEGIINPVNDLFVQLRNNIETDIELRRKKRIFDKDEELGLRPDTVNQVVRRLQNVDLFGIDEDLNGRLFETFLNATMRGRDLGQFFTPRSVVKMMTRIANLRVTREHQDRVIDACSGSGGFLIEALTMMRNQVRANASLSEPERGDLMDSIANECLFGIDFGQDPPLARIARINMYLHGDGGSRIYYADALDKVVDSTTRTDPETVRDMGELRDQVNGAYFDVVLTNPPFSMKKELRNPTERRILEQYSLALQNRTSSKLRSSLRSSVMFIERYRDLLKPGGKLVTVVDDTLLSSDEFKYVRDFVRAHFLIRAIISLPGDTFKRSGSRVKTSVLLLEKKLDVSDDQPHWFYFFSEHLGVDDLNTKASDRDVKEAREQAEAETECIVAEYNRYLQGERTGNVLAPDRLTDRLDLRNCVPLLGRMSETWIAQGIEVKRFGEVVSPVNNVINPRESPDTVFTLIKVSYEGKCQIDKQRRGDRITANAMQVVKQGQMVFSTIRATDGAIGIVPSELDGALVSKSSYTVLDCGSSADAAYLWSVLRSHEIRADMQSISPGSGRYTTHWPEVGQLPIPWIAEQERRVVGQKIIDLWDAERQIEAGRQESMAHLERLGVESEDSQRRWQLSKAPQ